ncbi:MAG: hypothetical protein V2I50_05650 [Desulfuromusa sp.]|nr:hypothetical protein [Desulfuromusa sp.]
MLIPQTLLAEVKEETALPSLEMIEFLGTFEDEDEGWVDPFELLSLDDAELVVSEDEVDADE